MEGVVTVIVFRNKDNGWTVLRMDVKGEEIAVLGSMPGVSPGEYLTVQGHWTRHPTYGQQLKAESVTRKLPKEQKDILLYLSSGAVTGVGRTLARQLVDAYGEKVLDVLEQEPERLAELKGISRSKAEAIGSSFREQLWMRRLTEFLSEHDLPMDLAVKLRRNCGDAALDLVKTNPWMLTREEYGVRFADADRIALSLGLEETDSRRLEAALLFELSRGTEKGHVFLPRWKLLEGAAKLLRGTSPEDLSPVLDSLQSRGEVFREDIGNEDAVYLPDLYAAEMTVARRILEMAGTELTPPAALEQVINLIQEAQGIVYAPQQREAVEIAARSQVMILTGGPGTGKTTCTRGVLALYDALGLETALAAPTGRAAKRLGELCQADASTIHRLLEPSYDPKTDSLTFAHNIYDPLPFDAVIVDETSMVDIPLMAALLDALPGDCRLLLVGDPDQLPSVGPGSLFSDLIRSGAVPTVRLTEIFRQAARSCIVQTAHQVNRGEMPDLQPPEDSDFRFIQQQTPRGVLDTIVDLCLHQLPEKMHIPPDQIQVLSPTRLRETGTSALNQMLQTALNPPDRKKPERRYGTWLYRKGDRVMQVHNNYTIPWREPDSGSSGMGIFNGEIGTIRSVTPEGITVDFDGKLASYGPELLNELEAAYAITVHKAQGSEYRAVILAAYDSNPFLMTRGVLYTAITRARELLVIVGTPQRIGQMVSNSRQDRRYSGLYWRLTNPEQCM